MALGTEALGVALGAAVDVVLVNVGAVVAIVWIVWYFWLSEKQ